MLFALKVNYKMARRNILDIKFNEQSRKGFEPIIKLFMITQQSPEISERSDTNQMTTTQTSFTFIRR